MSASKVKTVRLKLQERISVRRKTKYSNPLFMIAGKTLQQKKKSFTTVLSQTKFKENFFSIPLYILAVAPAYSSICA